VRLFGDVLPGDTPSARMSLGPDGPVYPAGATSDPVELDRIARETSTEGAALFMDGPLLGLGSFATGIDSTTGQFTHEGTDTMGPIPVALFEPRKVLAATDTTTGRTVDIQIEAICQAGFPRFAPVVAQIEPVDGWAVRRGRDGLELVDQAAACGRPLTSVLPRTGFRRPPAVAGCWCCTGCVWVCVSRRPPAATDPRNALRRCATAGDWA